MDPRPTGPDADPQLPRPDHPSVLDVAITAAFVVLTAGESVLSPGAREPWELVVAVVGVVALAWRRTHPVAAAGALVLSNVVTDPEGQFSTLLALVVACYSVGFHARPPRSYVGLAVVVVPFVVAASVFADFQPSDLAAAGVFLVGSWAVGWASARRALATAVAIARADRAEREQQHRAEQAALAERGRLARELHDVVSHSLSVVTIQVQAVRRRLGDDHPRESGDLAQVEAVSREALAEMRRLLGVLRQGDTDSGPDELAPQPGLGDLPRLVQRASTERTEVVLRIEGAPSDVSPGLDLAAYRVVQEALTNATRHADATRVEVLVRWEPAALTVGVRDDGRGSSDPTGGHGLVGMRERVELYGGTLDVGSVPGQGFSVTAGFPVPVRVDA